MTDMLYLALMNACELSPEDQDQVAEIILRRLELPVIEA